MPAAKRHSFRWWVEGVAELHASADHLPDLQELAHHAFSGTFVLAGIAQVVTVPTGELLDTVENTDAAVTPRAEEPMATAAEMARRFSKRNCLADVTPSGIER